MIKEADETAGNTESGGLVEPIVMRELYDIVDHKSDLHLLDNAESNIKFDGGEYFMDESAAMADWSGNRCINPEDYELSVVELHKGDTMIEVSKHDVIALAKHFGIIDA